MLKGSAYRKSVVLSVGWLLLGLAVALVVWALSGPEDAGVYTSVYLIERALSLDNLFVFLILFTSFGIPVADRSRLLFWGIAGALLLRGVAIAAGAALIEEFHFVLYVLGAGLLVLAWRMLRSDGEHGDPTQGRTVRVLRRVLPARYATPAALCLGAIVVADVAFAIDSIPAAFAITRDEVLIWLANAFALFGLHSLFTLVEGLVARFRYLDETLAVVLAFVGVKILIEELVVIGPALSLAVVAALFAAGIGASLYADRYQSAEEG